MNCRAPEEKSAFTAEHYRANGGHHKDLAIVPPAVEVYAMLQQPHFRITSLNAFSVSSPAGTSA